jgi:hypothetical protein
MPHLGHNSKGGRTFVADAPTDLTTVSSKQYALTEATE